MKMTILSRSSAVMICVVAVASCTASPPLESTSSAPTGAAEEAVLEPQVAAQAEKPAKPSQPIRSDFWFDGSPQQGGLVVARAPTGVDSVKLDGQSLPVTPDGFFLMGFNRDAEKAANLSWAADGAQPSRMLAVRPGKWKIERVNVSRRGNAKTSAEFNRRRAPELAQINAARAEQNDSGGWRQDFIWPVKGRLSGFFGAQRIYRGTPGGYHTGLDIAAPNGTSIVAPADGVITLSAKKPFTREGYLLMIDHGMGLNSAFVHCSQLLVNKGDVVKQGQVVARVGRTGSATGPHLHWSMKWNAARVDPLLLLPPQ